MKEVIKNIIQENQNVDLPKIIERNIGIPINTELIISLIGARRSGKTYILYQLISQLLEKKIAKENILFLNFEDERLKLDVQNLDEILQAFQELYPEKNLNSIYFFFDEIQNISGWEKFIRRVYDTKSRKIFITGSNSKLLSTEIATELRGRTISFTIFPLSFAEYLQFKAVDNKLYPQKNKSKIIKCAEDFLSEGGFPETINFDSKIRLRILQQYFNVMIFRDIVERYQVAGSEILKFFIKKIFACVTKTFSVNKTYNDIKSLGYKISNKYLYEYTNYCEAIFLSLSVSKFSFSEIKQAKSDKKMYIIDNGLLSSIEYSVSQNKGKLLENAVALEFFKREESIFYFKEKYECDFILEKDNKFEPIQVSYTLENSETKSREIRALIEAFKFLNVNEGTIITFDEEFEIIEKEFTIKVIPFYKYFLK